MRNASSTGITGGGIQGRGKPNPPYCRVQDADSLVLSSALSAKTGHTAAYSKPRCHRLSRGP
eukprot:4326575-Prorocentrum_lima.AAC.1